MTLSRLGIALVVGLSAWPGLALGQEGRGTVERLYVIECGQGHADDVSRWSPGVNVGKPIDYVSNCYLIKHPRGYMMWEAGVGDEIAALPEGRGSFTRWRLARTLRLPAPGARPQAVRREIRRGLAHPFRPYRKCRAVSRGHAAGAEGRI